MDLRLKIILWIIILIYIIVFGTMASLRHYNFQTQTWDMGIFTQIMWNIVHGNGMANSLEFVSNHFAVHMSPFLFLLAPGFALFPSAYYLLLLQTVALALGAWPLYLLAKRILQNQNLALTITAAYLLYPALHWVNWFDFHPIAFLVPFFLTAFYFYEAGKFGWMWAFLALSASTQEDAILVVAFFGIYLIFKKEWKIGIAVILLSIFYFLVSTQLIMPRFGGGLLRLDRYAQLGGSFSEIFKNVFLEPSLFIKTIFMWPKLTYLFWLFLPVAFLPFLAWREMILLIPGLAQNLLTLYPNQFSGTFQYDSALIAGIFIATVYGLKKANDLFVFLAAAKQPSGLPAGKTHKKVICVLLSAALLAFLIRSPISPFNFPTELFQKNPRAEAFREITKIIPKNASVAAHTNLVPHLATRERIYMLGLEPFMTDYVIADGADYFGFGTPEIFQNHIQRYADSGKYNAQIIDSRYYLLKKTQE